MRSGEGCCGQHGQTGLQGRAGPKADECFYSPTRPAQAGPVRARTLKGCRGARLLIVISGLQALDDLLWRVRPVVFVRVESPVEFRGSIDEVGG